MRWRIILEVCGLRIMVGRCPECGWPKVAIVAGGVMREWPRGKTAP